MTVAVGLMSTGAHTLVAARPSAPRLTSAPVDTVFTLPAPSGKFGVGTVQWLVVDSTRIDTLITSTGTFIGPRRLPVTIWYPTRPRTSGARAPYLRHGPREVAVLAALQRRADSLFAPLVLATGHGVVDAPVSTQPSRAMRRAAPGSAARFPVVLLSHGYLSSPSVHTELAVSLASDGWVVLAVAHTGEAQAVRFPDGVEITMLSGGEATAGRPAIAPRPLAVISEWSAEDSVLTASTAAADAATQRAILARYLATVPASARGVSRWVADLRAVLDAAAQPVGAPNALPARLTGRLDLGHVAAVGHSFGGVSAAAFCRVDARCASALNLDGLPPYGILDAAPPGMRSGDARLGAPFRHPLLMLYTERAGRVGGSDVLYGATASPYRSAVLRGARHLDPTDWTRFGPQLRRGAGFGTITPDAAARATIALVTTWVQATVLGRPSALLDGRDSVPMLNILPR